MGAKLGYIHEGRASGGIAARLLRANMDVGALRPFIANNGKSYVSLFNGFDNDGKPKRKKTLANAATLRKDEWQLLDEVVMRVQRDQLNVWADIVGAGLTKSVPDAMSLTVLQHQTMTDAGEATLSMSPLRKTKRDRPEFGLAGVPLPIVHSDFSFDVRSIAASRRMGQSIDDIMIEQATRQCVQLIEDLTVGTLASYTYAGYTIYGLTNHPSRLTKVLTLPTSVGWTPETTYNEVLDMLQQLDDINFDGPFGIYFSRGWTKFLSMDYSSAYPGATLRSKLNEIDEISFVRKSTRLGNYQILIIQLDRNTIEAITGIPLQTVAWGEEGGFEMIFKVMGIMVPRVRADANSLTGICHGVAA